MKERTYPHVISFLIIALCLACQQNNPPLNLRIPSVCIWDGASLRSEPKKDGRYIDDISLGETVTWLGPSVIDSSGDKPREYIKIALSDSTIGWTYSYLIVTHAIVGALKVNTPIYKRPDAITMTEESLQMMDMVAVIKQMDGWAQIIGEKRNKKGWIRESVVTTSKPDVTVAILAVKELRKNNDKSRKEKIRSIINRTPHKDAYFIRQLREMIE